MFIIVFSIGLTIGLLIRLIINHISHSISNIKETKLDILIVLLTAVIFLVSFLKFGLSIIFIKAIILGSILEVASFVDLRHRIIPNKLVIFTLVMGLILMFIKDISFTSSILGMILGGGLLFLLGLIPNVMGGGDIKFMFALGLFLGYTKTLWALVLAFVSAAFISAILLLLKIKGRKDHIPFGPFLALGTFISFLFF